MALIRFGSQMDAIYYKGGRTSVARNFDWRGTKHEKNCDVILATFFGDVMVITSLK